MMFPLMALAGLLEQLRIGICKTEDLPLLLQREMNAER